MWRIRATNFRYGYTREHRHTLYNIYNHLFVQTIDAATKEQADEQPTLQQDDEDAEKPKPDDEIAMDVDDEELQVKLLVFTQ